VADRTGLLGNFQVFGVVATACATVRQLTDVLFRFRERRRDLWGLWQHRTLKREDGSSLEFFKSFLLQFGRFLDTVLTL